MQILNIKVDNLNLQQVIETITKWININPLSTRQIVTINPEMVVQSKDNKELINIINQSDLSIADGTGIVWASKKYGQKIGQKIPGVDLIYSLAKISPSKKWRWYLIGGASGVAKKAANQLKTKFPGINIVKSEDGGLITLENIKRQGNLITRINQAKVDILIVSLGVPKQEFFIHNYKNILNAKVAIGAGGTLDFIAGKQKRAPKLLRKIGLEWLWRLLLSPKRLKRIINAVIIFPLIVIKDIRKKHAYNK